MPDASFFQEKAQQCRELSEIAIRPEVSEQLRERAEEFTALTEAADQSSVQSEAELEPTERLSP